MSDGQGGGNRPKPGGTDAVWRRAEIASPCVKICVLHPRARICVGCYRTGEEIGAWSRMSPEDRARLMAELPARAALLTRREGGAAARRRREGEPGDGTA